MVQTDKITGQMVMAEDGTIISVRIKNITNQGVDYYM